MEIAASATMDLLIGKLASLIQNEISMIGNLANQLSTMQERLTDMQSFLEGAREKSQLKKEERSWVGRIRDKVMKAEVVIDEYLYYKAKQRSRRRHLRHTIYLPMNLWEKRRIARKLHKIVTHTRSIHEELQQDSTSCRKESTSNFGDDNNDAWLKNRAELSRFVTDEDLVGIDDDKEKILKWLTGGEPHREVMSVVGMGGLGKTTLVASVCKNQVVQQEFKCSAWITVSQQYTVNELLKKMIKEFFDSMKEKVPKNLGIMENPELVNLLVNFLGEKRYVLVLDDVWSVHLWDDVKVCLPNNGCGSRVILTTRLDDIGTIAFGVRSHLYKIKPLRMVEARTLFCKKAFSDNPNNCCPPPLEKSAMGLINKCGGLPLALVVLGGAMYSKKKKSDWERMNNNIDFELKNNPKTNKIQSILMLSYHALPNYLKHCFLYCCLFPEDFNIFGPKLINLWMAEGFLETDTSLSQEKVGEYYLKELIRRNTLQLVGGCLRGKFQFCKMHDLMRELGLSICKEEKICDIYTGQRVQSGEDTNGRTRLLSIQTNDHEGLKSWRNVIPRLRSVLVFPRGKVSSSSMIETLLSRCRLLRVLDLEDVEIFELPNKLGDLLNLRYLNLRGTKLKELPKSIGRLRNLQTLNISSTEIQVLPNEITKLKNLRHLVLGKTASSKQRNDCNFHNFYSLQTPATIHKLKNLQVMTIVQAEARLIKSLMKMTQLTILGIGKVRATHEKELGNAIQSMNLLRELRLVATDENEYLPTMDAISPTSSNLESLNLFGKLGKVPHWFDKLESLTSLNLECCRLTEDPLPYIQCLHSLMFLTLNNAYTGNKLCFNAGFKELIELRLLNLPHLEEIIIEKGVMLSLNKLDLKKFTKLKMLPDGIKHLSNLQILKLSDVPNELVERIRGGKSIDRPKVQHIPQIDHFYRSLSKWCYESLSRL